MVFFLNDISNFFPLVRGWIYAGRVVSTAMKQHKRSFRCCLEDGMAYKLMVTNSILTEREDVNILQMQLLNNKNMCSQDPGDQ